MLTIQNKKLPKKKTLWSNKTPPPQCSNILHLAQSYIRNNQSRDFKLKSLPRLLMKTLEWRKVDEAVREGTHKCCMSHTTASCCDRDCCSKEILSLIMRAAAMPKQQRATRHSLDQEIKAFLFYVIVKGLAQLQLCYK